MTTTSSSTLHDAMHMVSHLLETWECDFARQHGGRKPTVNDAPPLVRARYRERDQLVCRMKEMEEELARRTGGGNSLSRKAVKLSMQEDSEVLISNRKRPPREDGLSLHQEKPASSSLDICFSDEEEDMTSSSASNRIIVKQQQGSLNAKRFNIAGPRPVLSTMLPLQPINANTLLPALKTDSVTLPARPTHTIIATPQLSLIANLAQHENLQSSLDAQPPLQPPKPKLLINTARPQPISSRRSTPNFVKLDLRSKSWKPKKPSAGSKLKRRTRENTFKSKRRLGEHDDGDTFVGGTLASTCRPDDVLDLVQHPGTAAAENIATDPRCHHDTPCIRLTVKKNTNGNRGKEFFGCGVGSQHDGGCGFFMWVDDTVTAAKQALLSNKEKDVSVTSVSHPFKPFADMTIHELSVFIKSRARHHPPGKNTKQLLIKHAEQIWEEDVAASKTLADEITTLLGPGATTELDLDKILDVVFRHDEFLPMQREAIERVVMQQTNSFVVRATGSGKSLIYQMAAFVLPGLTLVISPLIALMNDQLSKLPPGLHGAFLAASQTAVQQAQTLADVQSGKTKILFVSPERLFVTSFQRVIHARGVSLVCVDEAHCVSSWSHNFRPCYLRLGACISQMRVPNSLTQTPVILALTATATKRVARDVCKVLGCDNGTGGMLTQGSWLRSNLKLRVIHVSSDVDRFTRLLSEVEGSNSCCIVYTTTKVETEVLAERLTQNGIKAKAYHAGMVASLRAKNQDEFMRNKLDVVVATVAFGMGLDKSDVRRVMHYRAPRSIEEYVQEIGRAGRDGKQAECVCFLDGSGKEFVRAKSLARSDGIEMEQIVSILTHLKQDASSSTSGGVTVVCPIAKWSLDFDVKETVLETLLVRLADMGMIKVLPNAYSTFKVVLGADYKRQVSANDVARRMLIGATKVTAAVDDCATSNTLMLSLADLMRTFGFDTPAPATRMVWDHKEMGMFASVTASNPAFVISVMMREWDVVTVANALHVATEELEVASIMKLQAMEEALQLGVTTSSQSMDEFEAYVTRYFEDETFTCGNKHETNVAWNPSQDTRNVVEADFRDVLREFECRNIPIELRTARALTRIVHGLGSPTTFPKQFLSHQNQVTILLLGIPPLHH